MTDRKNIPTATKLRLFAEASGHCQKPECLQPLFPAEMGGDKHIAEMAHVIPHGKKGPRHEERPDDDYDTEAFDNLILLCPTCHTIIDKDPSAFPRAILIGWKQQHQANLAHKNGIKAYVSRNDTRAAIAERMAENKAIWNEFAPVDGAAFEFNPESEIAELWVRRMRSVILPNHYRIQSIVEANLHHATGLEKDTFAQYKEHVRGLTERHVCGVSGSAIRFPKEMENLFA